ncbi:hypothetical protein L249_6931 [Ophiocordyceps polyrhachis-furcata BCC 54312]|uniref:DNL-type domain-containing protein n=1 Tax=Ophiocordyceps polyrhachis-furcata BCC 54312 TaxID=1330021 RepID=A0A367LKB8_9HYPO|nr:hypothetical protein L249_6931 [Ophiocordyceps polyrhachis-furcata BCC 54312]
MPPILSIRSTLRLSIPLITRPRPPTTPLPRQSLAQLRSRPRFTIPRPQPHRRSDEHELADFYDPTAEYDKDPSLSKRDRPDPAYYSLTFTCIPCDSRSQHRVSKHGYHFGSVLITCPGCRNRHVISDHLRIFGDRDVTVEDLMRERGRLVKRGTLGEDGDVEFWPDELNSSTQTSSSASETQADGPKNPQDETT